MVINDKALVREMKDAYKGWGYTVLRLPGDKWVIKSEGAWAVQIEGMDNVPNEVLALIVLHMGYLPKIEQCYRIYKGDKCTVVQKEVYAVALDAWKTYEKMRSVSDDAPLEVRRTPLVYGRRRVWQRPDDKGVLLIDPRYEGLIDTDGDQMIRCVETDIYAEGEISCVFVAKARGGANESLLEHLAQVLWT